MTEQPPQPQRVPAWVDLAVIGIAMVLPTLVTWVYFVVLADAPAAMQQTAYSIGKVAHFTLPVAWLIYTRRKQWREGMTFRVEGTLIGFAFGAVVAGAMIALYFLALKPMGFFDGPAEEIRAKVSGMAIDAAWKFAALGLFYSLVHSFMEEYYWRWFVFRQLNQHTSLAVAIVVSSLGFMAHHVILLAQYFGWGSPATWFFSLSVAVGGAAWAWIYARSKSIAGPWVSHLLIDAAIFVIGYDLVKATFVN